MIRFLVLLTIITTPMANATFLLSEDQELTPLREDWIHHKQMDLTHLLTRAELENGFIRDLEKKGIVANYIPQTCWDLYALLNYYRKEYVLPNVKPVNSWWINVNNALNLEIKGTTQLSQLYSTKNFPEMSRYFAKEITKHLQRYNSSDKMYRTHQMDRVNEHAEKTLMWLFADKFFPEIEQILVQATQIEEECYFRDLIPFWRHSRTIINVNHDNQSLSVMDVPLIITMMSGNKSKLAMSTLSYSFSLLANFINDGTMAGICDYGQTSACSLSYYMQDLRDGCYAAGKLPYYHFASSILTTQEAQKKLLKGATLYVVKLPKKVFHNLILGSSNMGDWFVPQHKPSSWIEDRGETSHPRFRGTHLSNSEESDRKLFQNHREITNDHDLLLFVKSFIEETQNIQILTLGGKLICQDNLDLCQKVIQQRMMFAEAVLTSENALELLKDSQLKVEYDESYYSDKFKF